MQTSLNEKYLHKFLISDDNSKFSSNSEIMNLLKKLNIKVEFKNYIPLYDIIENYEKN